MRHKLNFKKREKKNGKKNKEREASAKSYKVSDSECILRIASENRKEIKTKRSEANVYDEGINVGVCWA